MALAEMSTNDIATVTATETTAANRGRAGGSAFRERSDVKRVEREEGVKRHAVLLRQGELELRAGHRGCSLERPQPTAVAISAVVMLATTQA
jgi:hypothetical protein